MTRILRLFGVATPIVAVVSACTLGTISLLGGTELPSQARFIATTPQPADLVAPAPGALSSVIVMRDWREMDTSGSKPKGIGSGSTSGGGSGVTIITGPRGSTGESGVDTSSPPATSSGGSGTAGIGAEPTSSSAAPRTAGILPEVAFTPEFAFAAAAARGSAGQFGDFSPAASSVAIPAQVIPSTGSSTSIKAETDYLNALYDAAREMERTKTKSTKSSKKTTRK